MDVEPVIPAPLDDDDDDVAWALQTAAVQWQRGAHADAVVWIRRAVDAAIACGNAQRTSDLTRLATEVADRIVARVSEIPDASDSRPPAVSDVDDPLGPGPVPEAAGLPPPRKVAHTLSNEIPFEFEADIVEEEGEDAAASGERHAVAPAEDDDGDDLPTLPPAPREDDDDLASSADVGVPPLSDTVHSVHPDEIFSKHAADAVDDSPFDGPTRPIPEDALDALDRSIAESVLGSMPPAGVTPDGLLGGGHIEPEVASAIPEEEPPSPPPEPRMESVAPPGEGGEAAAPLDSAQGDDADAGAPVVAGIALDAVRGFEDLPEEAQAELARTASLTTLSADEEVGAFGAALVASGKVGLMPSIADVAASVAGAGEIVFTRGTLADGVALRVVALQNDTVVATWSAADLDRTMADCPWVADELRLVADRFQALAGALLGPLGDRLDDSLRGQVLSRLDVKAFEAGEVIVLVGKPVPGLHVVGAGKVEIGEEGSAEEAGPGDILFAAEVLGAGSAHATARAGKGGALVLFASRGVAHQLLLEVPPLIEILAG